MLISTFTIDTDISILRNLAERAFGGSDDSDLNQWFSFEYMQKMISENRGICLVATNDHSVSGFIYAQQENPINGDEGLEKWVIVITAVDPTLSGQGIGSRLLGEIEKSAKEHGASKMFVYTNEGDGEVIHFYEKNHYLEAGRIQDYQYGRDNSAVFLLKYL